MVVPSIIYISDKERTYNDCRAMIQKYFIQTNIKRNISIECLFLNNALTICLHGLVCLMTDETKKYSICIHAFEILNNTIYDHNIYFIVLKRIFLKICFRTHDLQIESCHNLLRCGVGNQKYKNITEEILAMKIKI